MRAASHFYKVLDEHTIIIAADTPQNRRAYEDLVIQTFFLSNADVKDMMTILRTLIDAQEVRRQRAAQRHHPARHGRQGEGRRADHRGQRQVEGRGGGRRRAAADQLGSGCATSGSASSELHRSASSSASTAPAARHGTGAAHAAGIRLVGPAVHQPEQLAR